jgi:hypothetical protein
MAIASTGSSGSSAGAIGYVLSEDKSESKKPEVLAGSFGTAADIREDFEEYNKLNRRIKNQATHISISLAPGEQLAPEKKVEFAEKLLEKLDFKNVPYLVVEHHDKEYEHFHIVAGRIREDGSTVKEWKIAERAIKATKELEKEFGLQEVEFTKSDDRRTKRGEYKLMERTGEVSAIAAAKMTIDDALKGKPSTREFIETLKKNGFDALPNVSDTTGKMSGFSFEKGEITFKSSAIAKNYSFQNLTKNGLDYDQIRDKEFLIEVKNEFTAKRAEKIGFAGETGDFNDRNRINEATSQIADGQQSDAGRRTGEKERTTESIQNQFSDDGRKSGESNSESERSGIEKYASSAVIELANTKGDEVRERVEAIANIDSQSEIEIRRITQTIGERKQNATTFSNGIDRREGKGAKAGERVESIGKESVGNAGDSGFRGEIISGREENQSIPGGVEAGGREGGVSGIGRNQSTRGEIESSASGLDKADRQAGEFADSSNNIYNASPTMQIPEKLNDLQSNTTVAEQVFNKLTGAMAEQGLNLPTVKSDDLKNNISTWATLPALESNEIKVFNESYPDEKISVEDKSHLEAYNEFVNKIEEKGELENYASEVYELGISMTISRDIEIDF